MQNLLKSRQTNAQEVIYLPRHGQLVTLVERLIQVELITEVPMSFDTPKILMTNRVTVCL